MKALGLLKKVDIFGRSVELRLDKSKKHKTYCGALMTMFIFGITAFVAFISLNQYIQFDNPYLRVYNLKQESSTKVNLSLDSEVGSNLQIGVYDSISSQPIDPSLVVIVAYLSAQQLDQSSSSPQDTQIQLVKCSTNSDMYCLESNSIAVLPFQEGDFQQNKSNQFLKFEIMDCLSYKSLINLTGMTCGSTTQIADALTRAAVWLAFNEYEVDPIDYGSPIRTFLRKFRKNIDNSKKQQVNVALKQMEVSTDEGLMWGSYNIIDLTSFMSISTSTKDTVGVGLMTIKVVLNEEQYFCERSYGKIQVYLAYVGGFIKVLTMLGEFITRPFARLSLNTKIVNEVFDFEGGDANEGSNDLISMEELQHEFHLDEDNNVVMLSEQSPDKLFSKSNLRIGVNSNHVGVEPNDFRCQNGGVIDRTRKSLKSFEQNNNFNYQFVGSDKLKLQQIHGQEEENYQPKQQSPLIKIHRTAQTPSQNNEKDNNNKRPRDISTIQEYLGMSISTSKKNSQVIQQPEQGILNIDLSQIKDQEIEATRQFGGAKISNVGMDHNSAKNDSIQNSNTFNSYLSSIVGLKKNHSASPTAVRDRGKELSQIKEARKSKAILNRSSSTPLDISTPANNKFIRKQMNIELTVIEDRESRISNKERLNDNNKNLEKESEQINCEKSKSSSLSDSSSSSSESPSEKSKLSSQKSQSSLSQMPTLSSGQAKVCNGSGPISMAACETMQRTFFTHQMVSQKEVRKSDQLSSKEQSKIISSSNNEQTKDQSTDTISSKDEKINQLEATEVNQQHHNDNIKPPFQLINPRLEDQKINPSVGTLDQQKYAQKNTSIYQDQPSQQPPFEPKITSNNIPDFVVATPKRFISNFSGSYRKTSNSNQDFRRNSESGNNIFIPLKSEGGSISQSPGFFKLQNRESLASGGSSPEKNGAFKFFACENNPNLSSAEKRSQSMFTLHPARKSIMFPMDQTNNRISAESNECNVQVKNSGSPDLHRSPSRRYSVLEKQKIFALTKLMDNYQNHQETKVDELKNFEKLIHSQKKKMTNPDSIFKRLFRQSKALKLRFVDYCLYYLQFFSKMYSEKKKQIKFSKQKVKERLDVVYIIQKLVEIDKLKMLLLNEDQLKLFEYLPKPIVHMDPQDPPRSPALKGKDIVIMQTQEEQTHPSTMLQAWSMLHQQKKPIQKAIEASRVYQQMMECDPDMLSETDRKLIDMLDLRIKEIFDVNNEIQRQKTMHAMLISGKLGNNLNNNENNLKASYVGGSTEENNVIINKRFPNAQLPFKAVTSQQKLVFNKSQQQFPQVTAFTAACGDTSMPLPPPPQLMNCKISAFEGIPLCDETQAAFLDQDPSVTINNFCNGQKGDQSILFDKDVIIPLIDENPKQQLPVVGTTQGEILKRNQSTNPGVPGISMQIDGKRDRGGIIRTPTPAPPAESIGI